MTKQKAIAQLENLKEHCNEMSKNNKMWESDVIALDVAIRSLKDDRNEIVIPSNATNGDVIKAMFPEFRFGLEYTYNVCVKLSYHSEYDTGLLFEKKWWNAPYRKAEEE